MSKTRTGDFVRRVLILAAVLSCGSPRRSVAPSIVHAPDAGVREESFAGKQPRPIDEARAKEVDAFIAHALARLEVPGAAVAIIEGNAVVYERVFGVRSLGHEPPITPSTIFMIGSITKMMTTP